jgi:ABC-type sugar transport system ATPase subunit
VTVEENIFLGDEIHGAFRTLYKSEMKRGPRGVLNELASMSIQACLQASLYQQS